MIYVTGDKHRCFESIEYFCDKAGTTKDDILVILGDFGVNYFGDLRDTMEKDYLSKLPITFVVVRGNHDRRPNADWGIKTIATDSIFGTFIVEPGFDSILYAQDGRFYGLYTTQGLKYAFVAGGAYSVDKYYRLGSYAAGNKNMLWFNDEQLSEKEMAEVKSSLIRRIKIMDEPLPIDYIFTHTCPLSAVPVDMFLPYVNQSDVDNSTEIFLEDLKKTMEENHVRYTKWFCGHWHTDRNAPDDIRFVFNDFVEL